jgi:cyclophilin family peptidyl-prolyl cis-trans isomerase
MASVGVDTGASQFYITLNAAPQMNGRCVVLGKMTDSSIPVLAELEKVCIVCYLFVSN